MSNLKWHGKVHFFSVLSILISRGELAMLSKFKLFGATAELTKTGLHVARLRMKMRKLAKKKKGRSRKDA